MRRRISRHMNLFPGRDAFHKALLEQTSLPPERANRFMADVDRLFKRITSTYVRSVLKMYQPHSTARRENARLLRESKRALSDLRSALLESHCRPFSELITPFVDPKTGEFTSLGGLLDPPFGIQTRLNEPGSELAKLMTSLEDAGVTFETLVRLSYSTFGYARSGITVSSSAEPLLWLPLGNSLFLCSLMDFLRSCDEKVTVVNLGAGPGAFESAMASKLGDYKNRIKLVSVERDPASLKILYEKYGSAGLYWNIIEGNFASREAMRQVEMEISSVPFVLGGYSFHHLSPGNIGPTLEWVGRLVERGGFAQIHDVAGGYFGGGQSPVNRLFFNFMALYHLSVFYPDKTFEQRGFTMMSPHEIARCVIGSPGLFHPGTTPRNVFQMVNNGSIAIFTKQNGL